MLAPDQAYPCQGLLLLLLEAAALEALRLMGHPFQVPLLLVAAAAAAAVGLMLAHS
jgi:hypothetical protein